MKRSLWRFGIADAALRESQPAELAVYLEYRGMSAQLAEVFADSVEVVGPDAAHVLGQYWNRRRYRDCATAARYPSIHAAELIPENGVALGQSGELFAVRAPSACSPYPPRQRCVRAVSESQPYRRVMTEVSAPST